MELQPIKEYQKYIGTGNKVYGIDGDKAEEILLKDTDGNQHLFNQFFVLDGMIYLSVSVVEMMVIPDSDPEESEPIQKEYFFSQTGGQIDEELEKDFPAMPESEHVTYDDALFKIETTPYPIDDVMTDTSRVFKGPSPTGYLKIDGCARVSGGLWYSVPVKLPYRPEGVYFYPENANLIRIFDGGRIW